MDNYARQLELEDEYSTASLAAGQQAVIDAYASGRATDIGSGQYLLAKAYTVALEDYTTGTTSVRSKYKTLLNPIENSVIIMASLREILNACASPTPVSFQQVLTKLGKVYESEAMLASLRKLSPEYTKRTVEYLDSKATKSVSHRYRTFLTASKALQLDWQAWTPQERIGTSKFVLSRIYESTGLFKWVLGSDGMYTLAPTEELTKHFADMVSSAKAMTKYPPMLVPPLDWLDFNSGGYLSEWFNIHSPMCTLPYMQSVDRKWVINNLSDARTEPLRNAMNKAQQVPYRINKAVLEVLRKAVMMRVGIMGLPSQQPLPKPDFPFPKEWLKAEATDQELAQFKLWKNQVANWYTVEAKRKGRTSGILSKLREMIRYQDEEALYFPTFIDWRGRLYFRSALNPQSNDCVKGVLEFSKGKPLGADGLFWLKVHVANSCGYDKHSPELKAKWCDENWFMIQDFINNPLEVDAPEPETAFTLLQAGLALQEALELANPSTYVCHVPVAMDATCSGLQHLSALTRDEVGGLYTNLIDNGADEKSDIYVAVAEQATKDLSEYTSDDKALELYWSDKVITRKFSKNPVMTKVYGSVLLGTIDDLAMNMADAGFDIIKDRATGKILYSMNALATPVAKALRNGVDKIVPKSAEMMQYLQMLVRAHKCKALRWFTPVGMPVINWASKQEIERVYIRAMGISDITFKSANREYNCRAAANGVSPNFIHSMDSAHLCMTIDKFKGSIVPIHDSFATHASDVGSMHETIRDTFTQMYKDYSLKNMLEYNDIDLEIHSFPHVGKLDLASIKSSRFMFG